MNKFLIVFALLFGSQGFAADVSCNIPPANDDAGVTSATLSIGPRPLPDTLTVVQDQRVDQLNCQLVKDQMEYDCSNPQGQVATVTFKLGTHGGITECYFDSEPF